MRSAGLAAVCLLSGLAACDQRADAPAQSAAPPPDNAARPSRPWDVASEPGLWRTSMAVDGRSAGAPMLVCHRGGALVPDEPLSSETRCDPPSHRLAADGFVRERRCVSGGVASVATATVVGDLASGFSIRAQSRTTGGEADGGEIVSTFLRLGPCPDGWRAGEARPEGLARPAAAPPPPSAAPPPRRRPPAPVDPVEDALDGTYDGPPADPPPVSDKPDAPQEEARPAEA